MFRKWSKKRTLFAFLVGLLVILMISLVSINFIIKTQSVSETDTLSRLSETAYMESTNITYIIQDNFSTLETLALFIQSFDDLYSEELFSILDQVSNNNNYVRIALADKNGESCSKKEHINVVDRDYFIKAINGQRTISNLIISRVDNLPCVIFAVPVQKNGVNIGVLRSVLQQDKLNDMLDSDNFSGQECAYIVQKDGTIIARLCKDDSISNIFEIIGETDKQDQLKSDFQNNENGFIRSTYDGIAYHYNYTAIKESDWYLINAIPLNVINKQTTRNMRIGFQLLFQNLIILSLFTFVMARIIYIKNRSIHQMATTIQNITQHVPGGVFRFHADTLEFDFISEGILSILGYTKELFLLKYQNRFDYFVSECERSRILSLLSPQGRFTSPSSIQYQVENVSGQLVWLHNVVSLFIDESGQRWYYAVMVDITDYKQFEKSLVNRAQNDPLTGLYNKVITQNMIRLHLESQPDGTQALFVVDFDNFKLINDTFGHPFGDLILETFSHRLKKIFRSTDILGRIGGDEFIIYMQSCFGAEYVTERAEMLCDLLNDMSQEKNYAFTFSIGIAFYPDHADNFDELFKKADYAMYQSKKKGKNCYTIYQKEE